MRGEGGEGADKLKEKQRKQEGGKSLPGTRARLTLVLSMNTEKSLKCSSVKSKFLASAPIGRPNALLTPSPLMYAPSDLLRRKDQQT
jgi:hypothetical protein